jgi:hypothetical protein
VTSDAGIAIPLDDKQPLKRRKPLQGLRFLFSFLDTSHCSCRHSKEAADL